MSISIGSQTSEDERFFQASQWQLIWWKFRKHKLAMTGGSVIVFLYLLVLYQFV